MELLIVFGYLLLKHWLSLYYDYQRLKLPPTPPPVNTSCIGFELPPSEEDE